MMLRLKLNNHIRLTYIPVAAVVLLIGCKSVGPDYRRSEANLPAAYSETYI